MVRTRKSELINPVIVSVEGERRIPEACFERAGRARVCHPPGKKVTVRAKDRFGVEHEYTGEGL